MDLTSVIIKPYHTEKSYTLRKLQENSCLAFVVNNRANKNLVRLAFKAIYNVDPVKINILNRKSQAIRNGTASPGRSKHLKIAYVILPKGMQVAITKDEMEAANKQTTDEQAPENKQVSSKPIEKKSNAEPTTKTTTKKVKSKEVE